MPIFLGQKLTYRYQFYLGGFSSSPAVSGYFYIYISREPVILHVWKNSGENLVY